MFEFGSNKMSMWASKKIGVFKQGDYYTSFLGFGVLGLLSIAGSTVHVPKYSADRFRISVVISY